MVSTRGVKFKFSEGEKVLCYEPDPTKAKVLYDSKVLEVIVNKDQRGRKAVEYLIHFQGWNSSWDRCVSEDYVLKDTDENRQLQRDLAQKAQLQLGAYLYRRERKKRHRKLSEKINDSLEQKKVRRRGVSSEDGSSGSQSQREGEDDSEEEEEEELTSSGESSVEDEERVPLELSDTLKRLLEQDHELITKKNKLVKLPAEPNVATILEGYVKHCAVNQLCNLTDKPQRRYRYHQSNKARDLDRTFRSLNVCKEIVDGVRIYFDFTLGDLLLYNQEQDQYQSLRNHQLVKQEALEVFDEMNDMVIKEEGIKLEEYLQTSLIGLPEGENQATPIPSTNHIDEGSIDNGDCGGEGRKRSLRSHRLPNSVDGHEPSSSLLSAINCTDTNGISKLTVRNVGRVGNHDSGFPFTPIKQEATNSYNNLSSLASTSSRCSTPSMSLPPALQGAIMAIAQTSNAANIVPASAESHNMLSKILSWKLVPETLYCEVPAPPSLTYGAIHLTRLFVKLPDLLYATNMPDRKLKALLRNLDLFLNYLEEHGEWFGEHFYVDSGPAT
ncbi:MSL complex subunit 3 [Anabrus simplex]|uniref:MSL complex subunit 3 n=1 Tax=Anabrus simplex TaxID=316456 RepID=UPI0035A33CC5